MTESLLKVGVLASGSGTNLQAIIDACEKGEIPAQVVVVISNNTDAYALKRAASHQIPSKALNLEDFNSREEFDRKVVSVLKSYGVELVVLAGYMLMVTPVFIEAFPNRLINIHPAILPSFAGTDGIGDALAYGVKVTGVSIHFVDEGCDTGPLILQGVLEVKEDDTKDTLAPRVHAIEHKLYPQAIKLFAEGCLRVEGRKVKISGSRPQLVYQEDEL